MSRRLLSGVALGAHAAGEAAFTNWTQIPAMSLRGIVNRLVVTPNAAGDLFDVQVRQTAGGGELFFEAIGATAELDVSVLWAYETIDGNLWIAVKNRHTAARTFTLSSLRAETVTDTDILHGAGAPNDATDGVDGDFYINTTTWVIYGPKAAGAWPAGVSLVGPAGSGGSGGTGSTKVTKANVALGTQANGAGYTWYEIGAACTRGLVSRLKVSAEAVGNFDLQVRSAAAGGGELFLEARSVEAAFYEITWPFYVEGTADSIWIGIRNNFGASRTFTLTNLRLERFA